MTESPWWRHAVIYQVYPRSFADSDGDGIGDLPGITAHLDDLAELGVDAIWLSPFYPSPQHDTGYDVADYCDVDPAYGALADLDALVGRAHELGLRVIVDLVPNHTSSDHPWFAAALAAGPGSAERARYVFREGRDGGASPPNNWESRFGGPAWTRVADGQWYLHLFDVEQPDLDWTDPRVHADLDDVLRFWLDRGVDGFRVDVAHGLVKADGLPDADLSLSAQHSPTRDLPMWDQPGVHDIYRGWRRLLDEHSTADGRGDRILVAEAWVEPPEALARYVRPDEMHQSFNFSYLMTPWNAADLRHVIEESLSTTAAVGAPTTWVLSNHDVVRHASRLGRARANELVETDGIGPRHPQPDPEIGLRRARAATTVMLALPGSAYLYQGEELGLPDATELPDDVLQDPRWERSGHTDRGRDGCRVPIPWTGDAPAFGFGPSDRTWLPQPEIYGGLARDRQRGVEDSTLELYRELLRIRRDHALGTATLRWLDAPSDVLAFVVGDVQVWCNVGHDPIDLPTGTRLVTSGPISADGVPRDTAVWLTA